MDRRWNPLFLVYERKRPLLMGLYTPWTALGSSNQAISQQRGLGFLAVWGGVDPRKLGFLPQLVKLWGY